MAEFQSVQIKYSKVLKLECTNLNFDDSDDPELFVYSIPA